MQDILGEIEHLTEDDRLAIDVQLAKQAEAAWKHESQETRRIAALRGIDHAAIDRAVEAVRYGS